MTKEQTRTYRVLTTTPDEDGLGVVYRIAGEYVAADPRGAIRQAVGEHGFAEYVAVAESGWHYENPKAAPSPAISWS